MLFLSGLEFHWDLFKKQADAACEGTLVMDQADQLPSETLSGVVRSIQGTKLILTGESLPVLPGVKQLTVLAEKL